MRSDEEATAARAMIEAWGRALFGEKLDVVIPFGAAR